MEQTTVPATKQTVRRMCRLTLLVAALGFGISSFVLAPIYIKFASDIVYAEAWWVYILYYLTEEGFIDLAVFAVCYPAAMYAVWQAGLKRAIRIPITFSLVTLVRFLVNFFMTAITDSALPSFDDFLSFDLPLIGGMFLLEILQYALPIALTLLIKRRYERKQMALEAEALADGEEAAQPAAPLFPFTRLVSFKNPLQLSAFLLGVVIFVFRFGMHQIYQYALYTTSGYTDGLLIMVLDLLSDLFVAVVIYFAALLLMTRFYRKDTETNAV